MVSRVQPRREECQRALTMTAKASLGLGDSSSTIDTETSSSSHYSSREYSHSRGGRGSNVRPQDRHVSLRQQAGGKERKTKKNARKRSPRTSQSQLMERLWSSHANLPLSRSKESFGEKSHTVTPHRKESVKHQNIEEPPLGKLARKVQHIDSSRELRMKEAGVPSRFVKAPCGIYLRVECPDEAESNDKNHQNGVIEESQDQPHDAFDFPVPIVIEIPRPTAHSMMGEF